MGDEEIPEDVPEDMIDEEIPEDVPEAEGNVQMDNGATENVDTTIESPEPPPPPPEPAVESSGEV